MSATETARAWVEPHEARHLPEVDIDDPTTRDALTDLLTAVCGFSYPGDNQTAILSAIRWLRSRPDVAAELGIGTGGGAGFLGGRWYAPGGFYETVVTDSPTDARRAVIGVAVHDGSGPHGSRACAPAELEELAARLNAPVPAGVREPAPAPDAHVSYVPGEDPGIAALREMVNDNRELLGIDGDGGEEGR